MEKHRCKLCRRRFANGRALGGHMRSHMVNPPTPPPTRRRRLTESPPESSSSYASEDAGDASYGLRENPKRSVRVTDPEFSSSTVSEAESSKIPTPPPRRREAEKSDEPASSVSGTSTEEDLAFCLIMLSRDRWDPYKKRKAKTEQEEEDLRSFDGDRPGNFQKKPITKKKNTGDVIHQCPICCRVFPSGQALGGHKRAHFNAEKKNDEPRSNLAFIDLNLPPPDQDYDCDGASQLAISSASVSDLHQLS